MGERVHLAATYAIGDPDDAKVEIFSTICAICGAIIDPLVGKVHQGTIMRWDVWTGAYEHRNRPATEHAPVPWPIPNAQQN